MNIENLPEEWKKHQLQDIAYYVNDKIEVKSLTLENYISTENMLPDRGGVSKASSLPSVKKANRFKHNDILFSNIRTYFKKLWRARFEGGSSNDVLVIRPKNDDVDSTFLYYVLNDETFFKYSVVTSKGTKMPRGDKDAIMRYELLLPSLPQQQKIAFILCTLDNKIELNMQMNQTLEAMAKALFKSWFVDFEPFQDCEFEESELGMIPNGWRVGKLGDLLELAYGKALKASDRTPGHYPVVGSSGIIDTHAAYHVEAPGIVIGRKGTIGEVIWLDKPFFPIDTTFYVVPKNSSYNLFFLYFVLQQQDFKQIAADSAVPGLNRNHAYANKVIIPNESSTNAFQEKVKYMFQKIMQNHDENQALSTTRDSLLPKLMSGEIVV